MSSAVIRITPNPRHVNSVDVPDGGLPADDAEVVTVEGYRSMRLTLRVYGFDGDSSLLGVRMETGMDLKDPNGFVSLGFFDSISGSSASVQRTFTDLQRYVRWRVQVLQGSGDGGVTFGIEGIAYD